MTIDNIPQVTGRLRERGRDGSLPGLEVRQLFCSLNTSIPEHQLKELNVKIDSALQVGRRWSLKLRPAGLRLLE